jgi:hypothetical protein
MTLAASSMPFLIFAKKASSALPPIIAMSAANATVALRAIMAAAAITDVLKKVAIFMIFLLWNVCHHLTDLNSGGLMNIAIQASSISQLA